jgi:hypothetical protein
MDFFPHNSRPWLTFVIFPPQFPPMVNVCYITYASVLGTVCYVSTAPLGYLLSDGWNFRASGFSSAQYAERTFRVTLGALKSLICTSEGAPVHLVSSRIEVKTSLAHVQWKPNSLNRSTFKDGASSHDLPYLHKHRTEGRQQNDLT